MSDITLSQDQLDAVDKLAQFISDDCPDREITLSGRAGSGKSTVLTHVVDRLEKERKVYEMITDEHTKKLNVIYTATTNQAAKLLNTITGEPCKTIHKLLGLLIYNDYKTGKTVAKKGKNTTVARNSLIVIDEASMIDDKLLELIQELTIKCKIVYVGDHKQLPPIKYLHCPVFEKITNQIELTTIHRQGKNSSIKALGEMYRETLETGKFPPLQPFYGTEIEHIDGKTFEYKIAQYFNNPLIKDKKVLAYTNSKVTSYNKHIKSLHSSAEHHEVGDLVITNKPIFANGINYSTDTIATVTKVSEEFTEKGLMGRNIQLNYEVTVFQPNDFKEADRIVKFYQKESKKSGDWTEYFEIKDFFADLRNIYASTVHKAQGQTYHTVFIDLKDIGRCTKWQDVARMLYVGITRATDKVYLYGDLPPRFYT